ncbi:lipid IV(A) 3-deoxy-D-manno-octulosonic acid transferase [Helicobacter vulpis]|uniref:lipid IV(A) 3-deoxy-D-manno-octulosonic acid transferase n=1 Tax=Helicobacter vulpis TaxID=2316076 RepID=UPI0038B27B34
MFYHVYIAVLALAHLLALPLIALWRFKPKYRHSLGARFFAKGHALSFKPTLWFHACSFGEVKSLEPLLALFPNTPILLTTTTQTGYTLAYNTYAHNASIQVRYLLFETLLWLWRKDLDQLQSLVVTEAELWLGVFVLAKQVGAQTLLINARISERSYPRYHRFRAFYAYLFSKVDRIYAQSMLDLERLYALGARTGAIFPNLKLFNPPKRTNHYPKPPKTLILGASTHPGEEVLILEAFLALQSDAFLCLAPRHPERFAEVQKMLIQKGLIFDVFSEGLTWCHQVTLIDALGVLNDFYAIADIVILGGAFAPIGGHNPLEPAFFGAKLISGMHIFNQEALFSCVQNYVLVEPYQLSQALAQAQDILPSSIEYGDHRLETLAQMICKKPINS